MKSDKLINIVDQEEWERRKSYTDESLSPLFQILEAVKDPEIPALSIWDMGILRSVKRDQRDDDEYIVVTITPTYSGCPAMDMINEDVYSALKGAGFEHVEVETCLSPAWTTSWMSEDAQQRMAGSGIAPPGSLSEGGTPKCPLCGSTQTSLISQHSSTACKALYRCESCSEPFDYFKQF